MPTYEYRCPECGAEQSWVWSIAEFSRMTTKPISCRACSRGFLRRCYTPLPHVMDTPGHYNLSVGQYVTGDRDLREKLRAASESATRATGVDHNYQPADFRDRERFKVDGQGLDATARELHDAGRPYVDPDKMG